MFVEQLKVTHCLFMVNTAYTNSEWLNRYFLEILKIRQDLVHGLKDDMTHRLGQLWVQKSRGPPCWMEHCLQHSTTTVATSLAALSISLCSGATTMFISTH